MFYEFEHLVMNQSIWYQYTKLQRFNQCWVMPIRLLDCIKVAMDLV